jgi:tRNA (adenine22-N1)-methyltransferase
MMVLILTPRLRIIADSIHGVDTVADIGSDHAHLPIYLIKNGRAKRVIATDINKGPVEIAKKRIKSHRAEGAVSVRQGNGLEALEPGEAEVIVVAGMGGILISEILAKGKAVAERAKLLILQPMKYSDKLRKWLVGNGFDIVDEELVKEQRKIYEVIWAKPGGAVQAPKGLMLIGDRIIEKKHPLAAEYINRKVRELQKILTELEGTDMDSCREKAEEYRKLLDYYLEVLQWVQ